MTVDASMREAWDAMQAAAASRRDHLSPLHSGSGGGTYDSMESRVTRLEVQMEHMDRALTSIDTKLDKVNDRLAVLPTKGDLSSWQWQWIATGFAIIALTVGGITGGLALIAP